MVKKSALILVLFAAASGSLLAQDESTGYEIGVYAGQFNWKPRSFQTGPPLTLTPIDAGFRFNDHAAYGVRANFLSKGRWAGELSYSYQTNIAQISHAGVTTGLRGAVHHAFYNEVFYPARYEHAIVPFLTAGLGVAAYRLGDEAIAQAANAANVGFVGLKDSDNRFAFNYGAGLKVQATRHLGFRGDVRHIFSNVPRFGLPEQSSNSSQAVLPIGGKLQSYEFSGGIYLRLFYGGYH